MFVVDTNVLVYAANPDSAEHDPCYDLIQTWRRQATPWHLTWRIIYEFLRVVTHPRLLPSPYPLGEARRFVEGLLVVPSLAILIETPRHPDVLAQLTERMPQASGNFLFDLHTAVLMQEHGIRRIYTRDTDFHRFDFIEVIDPLK